MIRVVLAEDHTLVREGLRMLLSLAKDIQLVAEASDGRETIHVVLSQKPDVLLLDMRMPEMDGLQVVTELAARGQLPPTLVLTTFDDEAAAIAVIAAGARGFLLKDIRIEQLVDALRAVAAGGTALRPGLSERAEQALAEIRADSPCAFPATPQGEITPREREVLRLMVAGYSNREIGRALFLAEGTVKNHVSNILSKLGVRDRTRAVIKALERGCV